LNTNTVKINFRASNHNGFPSFKIKLDGQVLIDQTLDDSNWHYEFALPTCDRSLELQIERYGKTSENYSPEHDQILEITSIEIDGILVPNYVLDKHSQFEFDGQIHIGSRYFGPNGLWTWTFSTPILTYILDEKITHEAQYNQDYEFPWAYKLGPNSVNTILSKIQQAMDRIQRL
jgi:hypothetical protein